VIEDLIRLIKVERVDDIPVLLAQLEKMQVAALLNELFPTHGHWKGELSFGEVVAVWLTFLVSQGDHCLSHVQPWVEQHLDTIASWLGKTVRPLDFSDDRLADILDALSDASAWGIFEVALSQHMLRVYELTCEQVRIDSTSAKTYAGVSGDGLFQFGHSKDHRPDLPQVKINLSAIDPLGLPLTTTVVSGESADDPLYVPEIKQVQRCVGVGGKTYIGDCKMAAMATRAYLAQSRDYYLCPLSGKHITSEGLEQLLEPVFTGQQELSPVYRPQAAARGRPQKVAEGFELNVTLEAGTDGQLLRWQERRLVVRSIAHAAKQAESLDNRLCQTVDEISSLNERRQGKKRLSEAELKETASNIITRRGVKGLVNVQITTTTTQTKKRRYGSRPERVEEETQPTVSAHVDSEAVQQAKQRMGWRVYATNNLMMPLVVVVLAYRGQYLIEKCFGRLKGKALSLTPLYLQTDSRVQGLIRMLTISLRLLTLVEFIVRRQLKKEGSQVAGLYSGNEQRATATPLAETILKAFRGVSLTVLEVEGRVKAMLSPLTKLQCRLLELLGLSVDVYLRLVQHSLKPALNLSEP
jgi:transposase